jgi:hypothetical protein
LFDEKYQIISDDKKELKTKRLTEILDEVNKNIRIKENKSTKYLDKKGSIV